MRGSHLSGQGLGEVEQIRGSWRHRAPSWCGSCSSWATSRRVGSCIRVQGVQPVILTANTASQVMCTIKLLLCWWAGKLPQSQRRNNPTTGCHKTSAHNARHVNMTASLLCLAQILPHAVALRCTCTNLNVMFCGSVITNTDINLIKFMQ